MRDFKFLKDNVKTITSNPNRAREAFLRMRELRRILDQPVLIPSKENSIHFKFFIK